VPANAEVWFGNEKASLQQGPVREFESPPLTPGDEYTYSIRARWMENGRTVERTKNVDVKAGSVVRVDFMTQDATNKQSGISRP